MIQCFARTVCVPNSLFIISNSLLSLLGALVFSRANYRVLLRNGLPLLLIPPNRHAAALTLGMYLPQGRKAKLAVAVLKAANAFGLLQCILPKLVLGSIGASAPSEPMPFRQEDIDRGSVGFLLCNPDHGCARVVAVRVGDAPEAQCANGTLHAALRRFISGLQRLHSLSANTSVFKWTDLAGKAKLDSELSHIKLLAQRSLSGVPEVRSEGSNSFSRWFEMDHYAKADIASVCDLRAIRLLESWMLDDCIAPLDNKLIASLWTTEEWTPCQSARERIGALKIRKAVVHGDFATWNLRAQPDGLVSIDWEWAEPDGVAGLDLCYGLLQEALLVKKLHPLQAVHYVQVVADSPACKEYLKATGWQDAVDLWIQTAVLYRNSRKPCPELLAILCSV